MADVLIADRAAPPRAQPPAKPSARMDSKVWQRAAADLNPPGVPTSFQHVKSPQNIASVLLRREFGGGRRLKTARALGNDREENFWAESESASKVRSWIAVMVVEAVMRRGRDNGLLMCSRRTAPEQVL